MKTKKVLSPDLYSFGDTLLLKAYSKEKFFAPGDDIPEGIISEMEDLFLIKIEQERLILLSQGKKAINAGGLENFFEQRRGFNYYFDHHKYSLVLIGLVIIIMIGLMVYGYFYFENYMISSEVDGFVNEP